MMDLDPGEELRRKHALAIGFAKVILQGILASGKPSLSTKEVARFAWDLVWALECEGKAIGKGI